MLKAIKELLVGPWDMPAKRTASTSGSRGPAGYYMPASAEQLLSTASRKQCLQQLWENCALPKDLYEQFYLQPLKQLMTLMQVLPATPLGEYAREGGLVDVTLQTTTYAVRLAKGHMLPPGAAPEEQSAQNVQWNVVVFYAALWRYLPLLSQLQGEYQSGRAWLPGLTVPSEPYRFRFSAIPPTPTLTTSQSTMISARLLPAEVIDWLSTLPAATHSLMTIASRQSGALPVIDEIVQEAAKLARGDSLSVASSPASISNTLTVALPSVAPTTENITSSVPVVDLQSAVSSTNPPLVEDQLPAETLNLPEESATAGLLSSALDMPVNDKPLAERALAPETVVGIEEDMQTLLSLMAVKVSAPVNQAEQEFGDAPHADEGPMPADNPVLSAEVIQGAEAAEINRESDAFDDIAADVADSTPEFCAPQTTDLAPLQSQKPGIEGDGSITPGEVFWRWLADGLNSNEIPINSVGTRVHLVSGFVFITVPGVFYLYLKQAGLDGSQREVLQEDFERLEKHRRVKGKRFYFAHLYETSERTGAFKRTKGYLVKASLLYRGKNLPDDSPVLVIP
ncbi:integrating conjugative element relaxase, PFGI-1 class [Serratia proteamaculans]|uniref:TraI domain-containing protein n=1 Tax=Serratia TaxID=613 RepID=UPI0011574179|nr:MULTISPECIES: TraI domain-containing protein [Serratia]CAI1019367.1 integrating conjugative element relaxase, PFGI-1 class [Serratia entomophila]CAI1177697.1 integrating conjugative element relaxase, PFGI-1 class [Serratia liquefaciens]CAI1187380.1 integrating conjugative element relaxase, PFGI-1 class [Serratia quinivorans]CAI1714038.1 integrating conjugative element relaxase, PFGI-1 class [Serratia proteamaculans]CAI1726266.1 integrating conjugative element relaxase, PFGI-1 class [Serrati